MSSDTFHLHIGLPKTATTYLQRECFPELRHVHYLGTPRSDLFATAEDIQRGRRTLTACVNRSVSLWSRWGDAVFRDLFGRDRDSRAPGDFLLSDEGVGRAGSRPTLLGAHLKALTEQAVRWGFGRVAVLCVFRRQDHWMASHYAQISDRNPHASQSDFEANVREKLDRSGSRFTIGALLDYDTLAAHLAGAVGPANLSMVPYEMLVADPPAFHARIGELFGEDLENTLGGQQCDRRHNVRSTADARWELRPARRTRSVALRPRRLLRPLGMPDEVRFIRSVRSRGRSIRLDPALTATVLREYERSNRALADRLGLDLAPYGYYPAG